VASDVSRPVLADTGLVIVAGFAPWVEGDGPDLEGRLTASALVMSALTGALVVFATRGVPALSAALVGVAVVVFVGPAAWWAGGRLLRPVAPSVMVAARLVGVATYVVGAEIARVPLMASALVGAVVVGFDIALSLGVIGQRTSLRPALATVARSTVHLGIAMGLGVAYLVGGRAAPGRYVSRYAMFWLVTAVAVVVAETVRHRNGWSRQLRSDVESAVRSEERRERAHWLHDDVCADLRLLRLQLEAGRIAPGEVAEALGDLDHQLRLRQLDELMGSGRVRIAEVIQPFLRRLQERGVALDDVPRFGDAAQELDERSARHLRHALGVLVGNSIEAGARSMRIRCEPSAGHLVLTVADDAGGFDLSLVPAGRGLDSLRSELGAAALEARREGAGTAVRVLIPTRTNDR